MQVDIQQKPKTFIVVNPVAGTTEAADVRGKIEAILKTHEFPYEIYETTPNESPREKVREAVRQGFKLVISSGGDGTLASVASGLVGTNIPMVVLPNGTWNALARNLDIPLQVDQALDLVFQEHSIRTIDVMQVAGEYFILNVSTGVGSRTMKNVKREDKRRLGRLADLWKAVTHMLDFPSYRFDVKIDGKNSVFHATELMVANSRIVGIKPLQLDPDIHMDDGKLNVCRIYAKSLRDYFNLGISMLTGTQQDNWNVLCVEALEEVEINSNRKLLVQGDGDVIGRLPVTVKIHRKAISIVTPKHAEP
jgi:YegS/Rv2252/BmrU family lipid kinase